MDALEEESTEDRDYFIDDDRIDVIADGRAIEHLVALLRMALGTSGSVDIRSGAAVNNSHLVGDAGSRSGTTGRSKIPPARGSIQNERQKPDVVTACRDDD